MSAPVGGNPFIVFEEALADVRRALVGIAVVGLFINLLFLVQPIYLFQLFDRVLTSGNRDTLILLTGIVLVAYVAFGLLEYARARMLLHINEWLEERLAPIMLRAGHHRALRAGADAAGILQQLRILRGFLGGQSITPFLDAIWVPVFVLAIWIIHPLLGLFTLGAALVLLALALLHNRLTKDSHIASGHADQKAHSWLKSLFGNAEAIHAMGILPAIGAVWNISANQARKHHRKTGDRSALLKAISKSIRMGVQVGVLAVGAGLAISGEMSGGGMIAASIILGRALAPIDQGLHAWRSYVAASEARRQILKILAETPKQPQVRNLPAPTGRLEVDSVGFRPDGVEQPLLFGVSFSLDPGDVLGVIGPTAAGKSLLCRLLLGVIKPTVGAVRLDDVDVNIFARDVLGDHVGYLPQDVELFPGTVADNISRLRTGYIDETAVIDAAKRAHAHDMIARLPHAYETDIGVHGRLLSGGQRQLIGLARAMLGQPRLVVLDEPNSGLDMAGEAALCGAIANLKAAGCTVVIVAHRQNVLSTCDKLLVLEDNTMTRFGTFEEVTRGMHADVSPPLIADQGPSAKNPDSVAEPSSKKSSNPAKRNNGETQ